MDPWTTASIFLGSVLLVSVASLVLGRTLDRLGSRLDVGEGSDS